MWGLFGEFVLSYMGLALFSVLVATTFQEIGILSIFVFIAPLAFARQMFTRTHSLQEATERARRQTGGERVPGAARLAHRAAEPRAVPAAARRRDRRGAERDGRIAVMLMDLDHFKEVNDTLGHHFGDQLLKQIGPRLSTRPPRRRHHGSPRRRRVRRPAARPARRPGRLLDRARMLEELEEPFSVEGLALDVVGSIGIAIFPTQSHDAETLLRRADVAMYAAKEAGGGYEVYAPDDGPAQPRPAHPREPGAARDRARRVEMYYQPKVRLTDGRVAGAEALIRWHHPERGLVPPDEFIPLVEKTVLLRPLTTT